eukprot:gene4928-10304_t
MAPWDPKTDSLRLHAEPDGGWNYAMILDLWGLFPLIKMHTTDFKTAAFKPKGWLPAL